MRNEGVEKDERRDNRKRRNIGISLKKEKKVCVFFAIYQRFFFK